MTTSILKLPKRLGHQLTTLTFRISAAVHFGDLRKQYVIDEIEAGDRLPEERFSCLVNYSVIGAKNNSRIKRELFF